jgi:hypothetical protein
MWRASPRGNKLWMTQVACWFMHLARQSTAKTLWTQFTVQARIKHCYYCRYVPQNRAFIERKLQKNLLNLLLPSTTLQLHDYVNLYIAQDVGHRLQIVEAWFPSQGSPCGICGEQSSTGTGASVPSRQSTILYRPAFIFIHLPSALHVTCIIQMSGPQTLLLKTQNRQSHCPHNPQHLGKLRHIDSSIHGVPVSQ